MSFSVLLKTRPSAPPLLNIWCRSMAKQWHKQTARNHLRTFTSCTSASGEARLSLKRETSAKPQELHLKAAAQPRESRGVTQCRVNTERDWFFVIIDHLDAYAQLLRLVPADFTYYQLHQTARSSCNCFDVLDLTMTWFSTPLPNPIKIKNPFCNWAQLQIRSLSVTRPPWHQWTKAINPHRGLGE